MFDVYRQFLTIPDDSTVFDYMRPSVQKAGKLSQLHSGFSAREPFEMFSGQIETQSQRIELLEKKDRIDDGEYLDSCAATFHVGQHSQKPQRTPGYRRGW